MQKTIMLQILQHNLTTCKWRCELTFIFKPEIFPYQLVVYIINQKKEITKSQKNKINKEYEKIWTNITISLIAQW